MSRSPEEIDISALRKALEAANLNIWDWHLDTGMVFLDPVFYTSLGYESGTFPANLETFRSLIHPDDCSMAEVQFSEVLNARSSSLMMVCRIRQRDNSYRYIRSNGIAVEWDPEGKITRMIGTHTDITDEKERFSAVAQPYRDSVIRQKALLAVSRMYDPDYSKTWRSIVEIAAKTLLVSRASLWSFRSSQDTIFCETLYTLENNEWSQSPDMPRSDFPRYFGSLESARYIDASHAVRDPRTSEFSKEYLPATGVISMLSVPIFVSGTLSGELCLETVGTCRRWTPEEIDFSASLADLIAAKYETMGRIRLQEELRVKEEKFQKLIERTMVGIYRSTFEGKFLFVNQSMAAILEYDSVEELVLIPVISIYKTPEDRSAFIRQIQSSTYVRNREVELVTKKGNIRKVLINAYQEDDSILGMVMDNTERKKAELELIMSKESAEESSRLKTSLLANMSHEFRTPMNAVLGFSDLISRESSDPEIVFYARKIHSSGNRLMNTLKSILDLADIEATRSKISLNDISIQDAVGQAIQKYAILAQEKGLYLVTEFHDRLYAIADENLLQHILNNLLDNAVKFTHKGGISIETDLVSESGSSFIAIKVRDTGIGIEKAYLETIFQEFRQISEGYNRSFEGSGLGLTLARKMTDILGGWISVESEVNLGSIFTLHLPASLNVPRETGTEEAPPAAEPHKKKVSIQPPADLPLILIVEDNDDNAEIMNLYLLGKFRTERAGDAHSAIQMARERNYNCILMDINLGRGPDGLQATKEIRKINGYDSIPVVAITGYTLAGDREKLLKGGCTHYLGKPFSQQELLNLVCTCTMV